MRTYRGNRAGLPTPGGGQRSWTAGRRLATYCWLTPRPVGAAALLFRCRFYLGYFRLYLTRGELGHLIGDRDLGTPQAGERGQQAERRDAGDQVQRRPVRRQGRSGRGERFPATRVDYRGDHGEDQ